MHYQRMAFGAPVRSRMAQAVGLGHAGSAREKLGPGPPHRWRRPSAPCTSVPAPLPPRFRASPGAVPGTTASRRSQKRQHRNLAPGPPGSPKPSLHRTGGEPPHRHPGDGGRARGYRVRPNCHTCQDETRSDKRGQDQAGKMRHEARRGEARRGERRGCGTGQGGMRWRRFGQARRSAGPPSPSVKTQAKRGPSNLGMNVYIKSASLIMRLC